MVINGAISSSLPTGSNKYVAEYFDITDPTQIPLTVCVFLMGYIFGSVFFGPLSEKYGRRIVLVSTYAGYTGFTIGCALAPTWPALLVFRLLVGFCACASYTIAGGVCADLYPNSVSRGRAMMMFACVGLSFGQLPRLGRSANSGAVCEHWTCIWAHYRWICLTVRLEMGVLELCGIGSSLLARGPVPPR